MKNTQLQIAANSPSVSLVPRHIEVANQKIEDQLTFDEVKFSAQQLDKVVKAIEAAAKADREPLQAEVKRIIAHEKELTEPLKNAVAKAKASMLSYQNMLARIEREAAAKAAQQAAQTLLESDPTAPVEPVAQLVLDKPGGLRSTKKARVIGKVNWNEVVQTLIAADKFDPEMLLKGLPAAMAQTNIREIRGIEIFEHITQTLR